MSANAGTSIGKMRLLTRLMKPRTKHKPQLTNPSSIPKKWNILRGDNVAIIGGPPNAIGERGIVKEVIRKSGRVIVEGCNMRERKLKGKPQFGIKAAAVKREVSVHHSNVNLICPVTDLPTRISRKYLSDGTRVRVSKRSGAIIPRPEILMQRRRPKREEISG
eukprot:CAMPEP_0118655316 /NCGR_PEP_ID=MMETSP0785-20121206/12860_1 /TAXON_ID=91992 /ORGANISM="Bolidomonas pacifica, Strain CCMP 1866" /LENGTH=162 /DNA_ID=CAMNT_0006548039 /DNA_START=24 /DNA_END=509 /DNA_ORIENTATION=-